MHRKILDFILSFFVIFYLVTNCLYAQEPQTILASYEREFPADPFIVEFQQTNTNTLKFLDSRRSTVTELVESYNHSSPYYYDPASEQYYPDTIGILDSQGFTYDLALCALVYIINGQNQKASAILSVLENNFYLEKNGVNGLLTSYVIDDFSGDNLYSLYMGIDGDRIHVGPNMWVALACLQYYFVFGKERFLPLAIDIVQWAYNLNHFTFDDGTRGAVSMGFGWGSDWSTVYSTENVLDHYAVLKMLWQIYDTGQAEIKKIFCKKGLTPQVMQQELAGTKRWLKEIAYNKNYQAFNRGYNEFGPDTVKALDTASWSIAAIGCEELVEWGINPKNLIEFAEKNFLVIQKLNGEEIEGFDFTDQEGAGSLRSPVIWLEGTGQMILAYQLVASYCYKIGEYQKAEEYRDKAVKYLNQLNKIAYLVNLPYQVLSYATVQPKDTEIILTYKDGWEIPRGKDGRWVSALSSTLWRIIGMIGFNPLSNKQNTLAMLRNTENQLWAKLLDKSR